jgi:hypothetical protein
LAILVARRVLLLSVLLASIPTLASAQAGFEYEVYSTHIESPHATTAELYTNFVTSGRREVEDGQFATHRALRSSLEITHGLLPWLEGSLYFVGGAFRGREPEYVGNRLRLTAVAPQKWNLPFDLGLTQEVGYARPGFAEHRWAYELGPILGKSFGPVSLLVNPMFERGFDGDEREIEFEPKGKLAYDFGDDGAIALEYYGSEYHHQLFVTVETEVAHKWEFGIGVGRGLTRESDKSVLTTKIEYHFGGER